MRIAIVSILIAFAAPARADECAGEAASSLDCSAIDKPGAMSISTGYRSDGFDPNGHTFDVKHAGYVNTIGSFDGRALEPIRGDGFFIDVRVHPRPHWYAGVDLAVVVAGAPTARFVAAGGMPVMWDSSAMMTMAGVVGARVPLGRVSLRAELVAGLHDMTLVAMTNTPQALSGDATEAVVQPRAAVDVWLHHWWVVEAYAGVNALDSSERTFGVGLGFHSQAFDGRY